MKSWIWMAGVAVCLALGSAGPVRAASYYVDDGSDAGDIWTPTATGNIANTGTTPTNPALTLGSLQAFNVLQPGDVVYIDTGTYAPAVISNTVVGVAGTNILFQGSTNGTLFGGSGNLLTVRGRYLDIRDVQTIGGTRGVSLEGASYCNFERIHSISNANISIAFNNSNSNAFRRSVTLSLGAEGFGAYSPSRGNYLENCIAIAGNSYAFAMANGSCTNMVGCIAVGKWAVGPAAYTPDQGTRNILMGTSAIHSDAETVADLQRIYTNWVGNAFADPMFVNSAALDFHLLSVAGYATNGGGGAVTNVAGVHSPAIDFGPQGADVGAEPDPHGGRVNAGLYGGTAEASKSRTNDWLFAMTFNDGGTLWQTGRLEWAASTNFGAAGTVDLQFTTNNWATTNTIDTVTATNESYLWTPSVSYPAVRWRVVSSADPAVASTNAKAFSIRTATNTAFNFYVNDGSAANDVYGMGLGDNANDGAAPSRPKRSLQAILDAYQVRGGDTVYIDTGDYATNFTTTIGALDSGTAGNPVRIIGSPNGSILDRGGILLPSYWISAVPAIWNWSICG